MGEFPLFAATPLKWKFQVSGWARYTVVNSTFVALGAVLEVVRRGRVRRPCRLECANIGRLVRPDQLLLGEVTEREADALLPQRGTPGRTRVVRDVVENAELLPGVVIGEEAGPVVPLLDLAGVEDSARVPLVVLRQEVQGMAGDPLECIDRDVARGTLAGVGVGTGCANAGRAPAKTGTISGTAVAAKPERRTVRRDRRLRAPAAAGCWCSVVTGMSSSGVLFTLPSPNAFTLRISSCTYNRPLVGGSSQERRRQSGR